MRSANREICRHRRYNGKRLKLAETTATHWTRKETRQRSTRIRECRTSRSASVELAMTSVMIFGDAA
jgi:hypothetical protein